MEEPREADADRGRAEGDPGRRTEATEKCCRPKGAEGRTQSRGENGGEENCQGADRADAEMPHRTSAQGKGHMLPWLPWSTGEIHPFM